MTQKRCSDCGSMSNVRYVCVWIGVYLDLCADCERRRREQHEREQAHTVGDDDGACER